MPVPPNWRIVGDKDNRPDTYIPVSPAARSLAVLRQAVLDRSPEQVERDLAADEAYRIEQAAEREARVAEYFARHAALLTEHAGSPILTALLHAHAPRVKGQWIECDGCPPSWDDYDEELQPEWPCPTWSLIEQGA
jgi:hypothetical protein